MNKNLLSLTPKSPMMKASRLMELESKKKEIAKEIEELKSDLLKVTQDLDVITLKTGDYTISRAKRVTPKVIDFKLLKASLDKEDIPYMTEEVFSEQMKLVFKKLAEENRTMEGLKVMETEYITIRIAK